MPCRKQINSCNTPKKRSFPPARPKSTGQGGSALSWRGPGRKQHYKSELPLIYRLAESCTTSDRPQWLRRPQPMQIGGSVPDRRLHARQATPPRSPTANPELQGRPFGFSPSRKATPAAGPVPIGDHARARRHQLDSVPSASLDQPARNTQARYNVCPTDPVDTIVERDGKRCQCAGAWSRGGGQRLPRN